MVEKLLKVTFWWCRFNIASLRSFSWWFPFTLCLSYSLPFLSVFFFFSFLLTFFFLSFLSLLPFFPCYLYFSFKKSEQFSFCFLASFKLSNKLSGILLQQHKMEYACDVKLYFLTWEPRESQRWRPGHHALASSAVCLNIINKKQWELASKAEARFHAKERLPAHSPPPKFL